ncbi:MAG TPA: tyrosine-type recombinase/integrase [Patescibacteria group bacterium]|nr:tyrosine-type recombinase/integrase [Patescibacteria group bacterium]
MQINTEDFVSFITIKKSLAKQSVRHCAIRIRVINEWFADKELTKENVEKFFLELKEKGLKNNTLNTYYFVFRQLKDYCLDRNLPSDFLNGFKSFKKTKPDIIIFTPEEIENILNTSLTYGKFYGKDCSFLDFRYRTMTMFLAYTGCRYAEAAELQIKRLDISAGKAIFINTKTNENRTVYFTDPLKSNLEILIKDRSPNDYVFRNTKEKQVHVQDYSDDLKRRAIAAGVTKRTFPHNFRHSYCTMMLEAGVPITEVATLVGHRDIQTTFSTYMHLADKTLQRAALRHPLVRKNVDPQEILKAVRDTLEGFNLRGDSRFNFDINDSNNDNVDSLVFSLSIRKSSCDLNNEGKNN